MRSRRSDAHRQRKRNERSHDLGHENERIMNHESNDRNTCICKIGKSETK